MIKRTRDTTGYARVINARGHNVYAPVRLSRQFSPRLNRNPHQGDACIGCWPSQQATTQRFPVHRVTRVIATLLIAAAAAHLNQPRRREIKTLCKTQPVDIFKRVNPLPARPARARSINTVLYFPLTMPDAFFSFAVESANARWKGKIHLESVHHFRFRAGKERPHPGIVVADPCSLIVNHRAG
ncbi:Uncharacterised protein [Klebsiella pneumoniae]|nr:Uncharacterised protein [Klebsiella pneumoniae]